MDDFRLYGFLDGDPFLVPPGPFEPREPTENNQLAGLPALPSQHPDIRDDEEILLHDLHLVYTYSAVSTAGPLDVEPCLTVPLCEQLASLENVFFIFILTLIAIGRGIREDNNGPPMPPTQISGTSNDGPMTSQAQQGESSHSQFKLTSQAHQNTGILVPEYPVTLKNDIEFETGQNSKLRCPECGKKFRSKSTGVINRHRDDVHSGPQICPYSKCKAKLKGKRKLKYHLSVHHKAAPP
jgi:hypothetical protein